MPKPVETCVVTCNGQKFDAWTTVQVNLDARSVDDHFTLTVVELSSKSGWDPMRLKPSDRVEVILGGNKVLTGSVTTRQAAMNATSHATQIMGSSRTNDLVTSSHVPKQGGGSYDGNTFEQIARSVGEPYGIGFDWKRMPPGAEKPFRFAQVIPGESSFRFLERLARQRGIIFNSNENGDLVGRDGKADDMPTATLEEGRNIVSIVAMMRGDMPSQVGIIASQPGNDNVFGRSAAQVKAEAKNPAVTAYRQLVVVAEEPLTPEEAQRRADNEIRQINWDSIVFSVLVNGWFRPDGDLWRPYQPVTVRAPSVVPTTQGRISLYVQSATFAQDANNGSTTTLELRLRIEGSGYLGPVAAQSGGAPNILITPPEAAKPIAPSEST